MLFDDIFFYEKEDILHSEMTNIVDVTDISDYCPCLTGSAACFTSLHLYTAINLSVSTMFEFMFL